MMALIGFVTGFTGFFLRQCIKLVEFVSFHELTNQPRFLPNLPCPIFYCVRSCGAAVKGRLEHAREIIKNVKNSASLEWQLYIWLAGLIRIKVLNSPKLTSVFNRLRLGLRRFFIGDLRVLPPSWCWVGPSGGYCVLERIDGRPSLQLQDHRGENIFMCGCCRCRIACRARRPDDSFGSHDRGWGEPDEVENARF